MAEDYTPPTVDDFLERFPTFNTGTDDQEYMIEALILEAQGQVDNSWLAKDYSIAIMYLVAHWLTSQSGDVVDRPGAIISESFGPMSRSYAQRAGQSFSLEQLGSSEYGRRFLSLRNKNFPGIAVV